MARHLVLFIAIFVLAAQAMSQPVVETARRDLAKRLQLKPSAVSLVSATAVVWPDAALGLPRRDEMSAQVRTPGSLIVLEAGKIRFWYTAGQTAIRFGGPESLWDHSILALMPVDGEPNLNADLVQLSVVGTNPKTLLARVSRFGIQPGGAILGVRRISKSGHALVMLARGARSETLLRSAFDFGAFASAPDGAWAVCERQSLASGWTMFVAGAPAPLPANTRPSRLAWQGGKLFAWVDGSQLVMDPKKRTWEVPPYAYVDDDESLMLNKSEHLEVKATPDGAARVLRVWFTGDEKEVARIPGLQVKSVALVRGWAILIGQKGGEDTMVAVDLAGGLVVPCVSGRYPSLRLFPYPPSSSPRRR